jgi:hypothetical protein
MINLRWSIIVAAAAFVISLMLGISIRGRILIVLIRALGFGAFFFFLAALIWYLINKYLPELRASSQDLSLMPDFEPGTRVNISLGDEAIPRDAALPPEEAGDDSVGNIAEMMNRPAPEERPETLESPAPEGVETPSPALAGASGEEGGPETPSAFVFESPVSTGIPDPVRPSPRGMDQNPQSGYTQGGSGGSRPPIQDPAGGFSALGDGDIESLPDLDALAGSFLSSSAAGDDEFASAPGPSPRPAGGTRSKKGRNVEEDFNPKELASAIQTILKRD